MAWPVPGLYDNAYRWTQRGATFLLLCASFAARVEPLSLSV